MNTVLIQRPQTKSWYEGNTLYKIANQKQKSPHLAKISQLVENKIIYSLAEAVDLLLSIVKLIEAMSTLKYQEDILRHLNMAIFQCEMIKEGVSMPNPSREIEQAWAYLKMNQPTCITFCKISISLKWLSMWFNSQENQEKYVQENVKQFTI